ncbi:F-box/WD repeat-containing protein 15-like [Apodemus sylvaticus]|uniref:F-box/WD repeat-containing protein 15-like n=1 Tax=Apodemus sylvaticus TaxID=10129 RepID=UPI002244DED7|nr:F-box/WD repeat-containing protein 15-like [Apodemus sylvaticus]
MEIHLPPEQLMKLFSYLDAFSLLQVAQVNKSWNAVASSDVLWRKFCQKRWLFCDKVNPHLLGTETWKQFYVYRTWQEHTKSRAKPRDFTYREIPVDFGVQANACYISGCGLTRNGQGKSVVCMVSSMTKISTWDIQEGVMTWESPEQPTRILLLTTLPEMHIAVTVDLESTIKLWDCQNWEALASKRLLFNCKLLKAVDTQDGPIVLTSDISGNLYIFSIPELCFMCTINVFPYCIDGIYCSPQKKWVFVNKKHQHIFPKVFLMSSLLRTSEFSAPVSTNLNFSLCEKVFWTPRREDRITLMSKSGPKGTTKFITCNMTLENIGNQLSVKGYVVAMFWLREDCLECMGVSDKDVIVCSTLSSLLLFSMNGLHLQTFPYYSEEILSLWVDPVHVIVTLHDGTLEVYAWEERTPRLRRCYGLQNQRYLPPESIFNQTLCDNMSIIQLITSGSNPWFLRTYTLKSDLEN